MIVETLIIHGGDMIEWRDSSGLAGRPPRRISPGRLDIRFTKAPRELRVTHKNNGTLLWHKNSAGPSRIVPGMAAVQDMAPQPVCTYEIEGRVADLSGRYLPRTFAFTLGSGNEHSVALYQSPLAARFSQAGGIYGEIGFDDGAAAPWALVFLTVSPLLGAPFKFAAQADRHGEFQMPLDRLPALGKDAPTPAYAATLEVHASRQASSDIPLDPGILQPAKVARGKNGQGKSLFASQFNLNITPGAVARVASPKHALIVLKST